MSSTLAGASNAAGLQAQIAQYRIQLNDWVTCVSASTPKGKAEIQSLTGKISADREQIARLEAGKPHSQAIAAATQASGASRATDPGRAVDIWV
jgi:hypothetical protein